MARKKSGLFYYMLLSSAIILVLAMTHNIATGDQTVKQKTIITQHSSGKNKAGKGDNMTDPNKLNDEQGAYLLNLAKKTIREKLFGPQEDTAAQENLPDIFSERRGTFVTLKKKGILRGCIGHIIPQESLIEGIRINAVNAAFRDPRFPPMSKDEWNDVKAEISILTDPQPLPYSGVDDLLGKLRKDIDGVIIRKGHSQSTFLPQVWEQIPDKKSFLSHLCVKAGLDANEWQKGDLTVFTYQVQAFEEE